MCIFFFSDFFPLLVTIVAEIWLLDSVARLNLWDKIFGKVERNSFIALTGKWDHSALVLSRMCVPLGDGSDESQCFRSRACIAHGLSSDWLVVR